MNKLVASSESIWIAFALTVMLCVVPLQSIAQQQAPDFEAPLIEHDETVFSASDTSQVFSAQVVDNSEVSSVKLFYRINEEDEYSEIDMDRVADSAFYTASVSKDENDDEISTIEYFIQAEDSAGNVVLKGFAFAPLTRDLASLQTITTAPSEEPVPSSEPEVIAEKPKSRVLYYVLGALAVGALAVGLSGGGDSGSSDSTLEDRPCTGGSCTVTFTLNQP